MPLINCLRSCPSRRPLDSPSQGTVPADARVSRFCESNTFSDFEIVCQGREWKVYRIILGSTLRSFSGLTMASFA